MAMLSWRPIQLPPTGHNDCGPGGRRGTISYHTINGNAECMCIMIVVGVAAGSAAAAGCSSIAGRVARCRLHVAGVSGNILMECGTAAAARRQTRRPAQQCGVCIDRELRRRACRKMLAVHAQPPGAADQVELNKSTRRASAGHAAAARARQHKRCARVETRRPGGHVALGPDMVEYFLRVSSIEQIGSTLETIN
jgi:hypothetical protein